MSFRQRPITRRLFALLVALVSCSRVTDTLSTSSGGGGTLRVLDDDTLFVADGAATVTIEATVADVAGFPLEGREVRLRCDDTNVHLQRPPPTDKRGHTRAQVSSTAPGMAVVTAVFLDSGRVVSFQAPLQLNFVPPAPAPRLAVAVVPETAVANGQEALQVRLTLSGQPPGWSAQHNLLLAAGAERDILGKTEGVFEADASFTTALVSTLAGERTLTVQTGALQASAPYRFVAGPADASVSRFVVAHVEAGEQQQDNLLVQVYLNDAFGNPVANQAVTLTSPDPAATFVPPQAVSDANGRVAVMLRTMGRNELPMVAEFAGQQISTVATLAAGPVDLASSSWVASASTLADGNARCVLRFTGRDAQNRPTPQRAVAVALSSGSGAVEVPTVVTDTNGHAETVLRSTLAETKVVLARVDGKTFTANANFVAGLPIATNSTLSVTPDPVAAGTDVRVNLDLRDAYANAVGGVGVTFSASGSGNTYDALSTTSDAAGQARALFRSTRSGQKVLRATAGAAVVDANLRVIAASPNAQMSTLSAAPSVQVADNAATVQLTALLGDAYGNPVAGQVVRFASTNGPGTDAFDVQEGTTDDTGTLRTLLRSTRAGANVASVTAGSIRIDAPLTFLSGPPDLDHSQLAATPNTASVEDAGGITGVVQVTDAFDNPVANANVAFAVSGAASVDPASGVSDANGRLGVVVRSTRASGETLFAALASIGNVTTSVRFRPGTPAAAHSDIVTSLDPFVADGTAAGDVNVTVRVRDAFDNPVDGHRVFVRGAGYNNTWGPREAPTDADGLFVTTLRSTRAQTQTLTAALTQNVVVTRSVVTVAAGPSAAASTVAATPNSIPATGFAPIQLVVNVVDAYGNSVANTRVDFTSPSSSLRLPSGSMLTDAAGVVRTQTSSKVVQDTAVVATIAGGSLNQNVRFTPPTPADNLTSALVLTPNQNLVADGKTKAGVELTVRDANGAALPYVSASLQSPGNNLQFAPAWGVTDANGVFRSEFTSRASGAAVVWAASTGLKVSASVNYAARTDGCTAPLQMGGGQPSIRLNALSATGATPQMVSADVDGDGHLDLVLGGDYLTAIAWGRGDGTFDEPTYLSESGTMVQLQAVDLDGDGKLDIIRTAASTDNLYFYINQGSRTFGPRRLTTGQGKPRGFVAADLNGDGLVDLAVSSSSANTLRIFRATSPTTWVRWQTLTAGSFPGRVYLDDLNGDGAGDLVLINSSGNDISVYLQGSDGNFVNEVRYPAASPTYVAIGDVNSDGTPDLVVGRSGGFYTVLFNRGDGSFAPGASVALQATSSYLALADLTGDGVMDLVHGQDSNLLVYRGVGDGSFVAHKDVLAPKTPAVVLPAGRFSLADFDEDGKLDYVALAADNQAVIMAKGRGDGSFERNLPYGYAVDSPLALTAADLDGDGVLDLVVASNKGRQVSLLRGLGDGTFEAARHYPLAAAYGARHLAVADLDLDGRADILACGGTEGGLSTNLVDVFLGTGGGNMAAARSYDAAFSLRNVTVADLNGDGVPDLVGAGQANGTVVALGDGLGGFGQRANYGSLAASWSATADVNGDGSVDVLSSNTDYGYSVWRNNGAGLMASYNVVFAAGPMQSIVARDLTGDGVTDVVSLGAATTAGLVGVGQNNGNFLLSALPGTSRTSSGPAAVADFNGDGKLDLAINELIYLGRGDGTFSPPLAYPQPLTAFGLSGTAVGDFDGDGKVDLAVAVHDQNQVYIYRNGGCGAP